LTPQLILWGLPGYIAYYLLQSVKPSRAKSGWDFVVEVGLLALTCFLTARAMIDAGTWLFPGIAAAALSSWPREYSFTLALGIFPVAEIVGVGLALTTHRRSRLLGWYHRWITGRERDFQFSDVFFTACDELLSDLVLITLASGKVYVGVLIAATQDPNEVKRFLRFTPLLSGYRRKDDLQVAYTTFYQPSKDRRRAFLVPVDQLTVLAPFDWERFNHFVGTGNITLVGEGVA
jgi:hypothetical protein